MYIYIIVCMYVCMYVYIYIDMLSLPWSTPMIPNEGVTLSFPIARLWQLCKTLLVLSAHEKVDVTLEMQK